MTPPASAAGMPQADPERTVNILTHGGRIAAIQRLVAHQCGMPVRAMTEPCRSRSIARPRQVAMYLAHELTGNTLPEIGRAFKRDHTTVLHACRLVAELMARDPDFAVAVAEMRNLAAWPGV